MTEGIKFTAAVYSVRTDVDFGIKATFALSQEAIMQAAMLMECHKMGVVLDIVATPRIQDINTADTPEGKKSRPPKLSARGA